MGAQLASLSAAMLVPWREGDVIRRLRMAAGWKLKDLASASGVDLQVIHRIEIGITKEPKRGTLLKIAVAFGLTDRQLLDAVPAAIDLPIQFADIQHLQKLTGGGRKPARKAGDRGHAPSGRHRRVG